jgi:hypothetical protein
MYLSVCLVSYFFILFIYLSFFFEFRIWRDYILLIMNERKYILRWIEMNGKWDCFFWLDMLHLNARAKPLIWNRLKIYGTKKGSVSKYETIAVLYEILKISNTTIKNLFRLSMVSYFCCRIFFRPFNLKNVVGPNEIRLSDWWTWDLFFFYIQQC